MASKAPSPSRSDRLGLSSKYELLSKCGLCPDSQAQDYCHKPAVGLENAHWWVRRCLMASKAPSPSRF